LRPKTIPFFQLQLVISGRLDLRLEIVTREIDLFPMSHRPQILLSQVNDLESTEDNALGIEEIEQFIEPGDQQFLLMRGFGNHRLTDHFGYLFEISDEAEHPIGRIDEHVFNAIPIGDNPYVSGMIDELEVWHAN